MKLFALIAHKFKVSLRQRQDIALIITFAWLAIFVFPLAIGSDLEVLSKVAPGLMWIILIFALHLSTPLIWVKDLEDGTLNQLLLSDVPVEYLIVAKALCLWLICLSLILVLIPMLAYTFYFSLELLFLYFITYLIASFPLSLLVITGATLTLSHPRSSLLSIILMIPLYIPLIIFSSVILTSASSVNFDPTALWILIGISLGSFPILVSANVLNLKWL